MPNNIPPRVWLLDCDPAHPNIAVFTEPYICEGCEEVAIEYRPAAEIERLRAAIRNAEASLMDGAKLCADRLTSALLCLQEAPTNAQGDVIPPHRRAGTCNGACNDPGGPGCTC